MSFNVCFRQIFVELKNFFYYKRKKKKRDFAIGDT